jgi:uncharacterized membrane protein YfcA
MGLVIGLTLGALGGGGSILTIPALVYVIGQDARAATTSSLVIIGISSVVAAMGHARSRRVQWGTGLAFGAVGIAAGVAGTVVNRRIDPDVLLLAFAAVILVAAAGMLGRSGPVDPPAGGLAEPGTARPGRARIDWRRGGKILAAGSVAGFMTGLFGVGGGFVIVPALTLALGLSMPQAVGTSLLVIAVNSAAALAARVGTAEFDWAVIVPFTLATIAGSLAGKTIADRVSARALTRAFAVLLIAVAGYTATRSILGLMG